MGGGDEASFGIWNEAAYDAFNHAFVSYQWCGKSRAREATAFYHRDVTWSMVIAAELEKPEIYRYHWGRYFMTRLLLPFLLFFPLSVFTGEARDRALWQQLHQQAIVLEKAGNYADAIVQYEQSMKIAEEIGDKAAVAKNLIGIGRIRIKFGEFLEATNLIQQGKKLAEKLNERLILVSALIATSDLEERQGRFQDALKSANRALKIALELKDFKTLSEAYRFVGHSYYSQGQFKIALKNYQESLRYAEVTKNPSVICLSLLAVGVAFIDTGDYDHGVPCLLSALEKGEQAGEREVMPEILSEIGIAYKDMGMFEESAEYYNRGLRFAEEIGQKEAKARILNNLGVLYQNEGRYNEATQHYQQSLKIAEELKNRRGIALLLNNIGKIYLDEGRFEEALSYFERSLKTREEIGDQWGIAAALQNMGTTFEKQKLYDKAVDIYQRSLGISEQIGNKSQVALTFLHLGDAYLSQGNYQVAEENYKKGLSLAREVHSKVIIGSSLGGLGKIRMEKQKYSEAAEYFQQELTLAKEVTKPEMIWNASYGLAKVYESQERYSQALNFYSAAIHEIERVRTRASSDEGKSGFLLNHLHIYEELISLLHNLQLKYPRRNYDFQAFDYSEKAKARMFLDTLAEFQSGIRKGLSKEQLHKEKVIVQKISRLQTDLWNATTEKEQKEKQKKLREAERELDQFILDMKLSNPQYAQLKYPEPYRFSQVQKHLDKNSVLLEFFLSENESFVFAVTSAGEEVGTLPGRTELEESVRKYLEGIRMPPKTSLGKDANSLRQAYRNQAHTLYQILIAPVQKHLREKENLILILDGILHYVPFETLIMDGDRLLIEDFRISYAPSATIWASLQSKQNERNPKALLAFADPVLSSDSSELSEELQGTRLHDLVRLRYAREEVEGIASLYPQDLREIYLAEEATEEKFQNEKISEYDFIHFATHALIDEEVPRRSGIVLTSGAAGRSDGVLQMHEIWNLHLSTKLVVLSACQTGLGKLVSGEGMVSLMRAFFYAGTKGVVVSLWNVDDSSTANLMKDFYIHMKEGKNPAESLRQAKLGMIQHARKGSSYVAYEDPYYWAPFILVGQGN